MGSTMVEQKIKNKEIVMLQLLGQNQATQYNGRGMLADLTNNIDPLAHD